MRAKLLEQAITLKMRTGKNIRFSNNFQEGSIIAECEAKYTEAPWKLGRR